MEFNDELTCCLSVHEHGPNDAGVLRPRQPDVPCNGEVDVRYLMNETVSLGHPENREWYDRDYVNTTKAYRCRRFDSLFFIEVNALEQTGEGLHEREGWL